MVGLPDAGYMYPMPALFDVSLGYSQCTLDPITPWVPPQPADIPKPANDDDLAFLSVFQLGNLIKTKKISCVDLTKFFLARLRKYDTEAFSLQVRACVRSRILLFEISKFW